MRQCYRGRQGFWATWVRMGISMTTTSDGNSMKNRIIGFGEQIDGYPIAVLNERAVRASVGILFVGALISFMNAWLKGNFQPTRIFVLVFLLDFTIRLFVNPKYSPSFMLGQWIVRRQIPEYVGAPQKRFAWAIGFTLALVMAYLMVFKGVIGPANILVCGACLILMFFETSFGICIGCKVYNAFNKEKAQLCPGGVCGVDFAPAPGWTLGQVAAFISFLGAMMVAVHWVGNNDPYASVKVNPVENSLTAPVSPEEIARCKVPEFAKKMGHEDMWKLHNNCK
jgi:hypothetical protein